jgi:esterase/lipase superfamily enzyme
MLFITNRTFEESRETEIGRQVNFDLTFNEAGQSVYFCERKGKDDYVELGNEAFFQTLRESEYQQILLYIHGFSNLPESPIFQMAQALQDLFDSQEPNLAQVVPIIWPCDNDLGLVQDYWDDQQAADASAYAFGRVFEKFMAWRDKESEAEEPCIKRLNVLAHSMGNRAFRGSIKAWGKYFRSYRLPLIFRNVFMVAADVVNESLEGLDGGLLCETARNVTVYYASDDLALRASKIGNLRNKVASRRLGHTGPENMSKVPKNVYSIDSDDVNTLYDSLVGHTYFLYDENGKKPGIVFEHIFNSVKTGRVPVEPEGGKTMVLRPKPKRKKSKK